MTHPGPQLPPLVNALLDPGRYPGPVQSVELIETHISFVLLAGESAYKIKKPVDLGFLDFSTLEKRRRFCAEEVRLNQRLAPEIYMDVLAIGGTADEPELGAEPAIEYAVRMRRFPQAAQLDRMLDAGKLQPRHLDAFARLIADFHGRATVAQPDTGFGGEAAVYHPIQENFQALRGALESPSALARLDRLEASGMTQFLALRDLLARRKRDGFVRECHGDLHLRNLAWIDDRPVAFDCIEFDPALRWIDVMNEVAFLTMDLQAREQPALAARFLNHYLERTGDYGGLALLPFYQVYRALVRAKVDAIRLQQGDITAIEKAQVEVECARYLQLARYFGAAGSPQLIITRGLSGSGKTTFSAALLERLGAVRIRSDVERKRLFGLSAEQHAGAAPGQGIYTADASRKTYATLLELADAILRAGYPVIVDGVFAEPAQRAPFQMLAAKRGLPYLILEFTARPDTLRERVRTRAKGASDAGMDVLASQLARWHELPQDEQVHRLLVDTEQTPDYDRLVAEIGDRLNAD